MHDKQRERNEQKNNTKKTEHILMLAQIYCSCCYFFPGICVWVVTCYAAVFRYCGTLIFFLQFFQSFNFIFLFSPTFVLGRMTFIFFFIKIQIRLALFVFTWQHIKGKTLKQWGKELQIEEMLTFFISNEVEIQTLEIEPHVSLMRGLVFSREDIDTLYAYNVHQIYLYIISEAPCYNKWIE